MQWNGPKAMDPKIALGWFHEGVSYTNWGNYFENKWKCQHEKNENETLLLCQRYQNTLQNAAKIMKNTTTTSNLLPKQLTRLSPSPFLQHQTDRNAPQRRWRPLRWLQGRFLSRRAPPRRGWRPSRNTAATTQAPTTVGKMLIGHLIGHNIISLFKNTFKAALSCRTFCWRFKLPAFYHFTPTHTLTPPPHTDTHTIVHGEMKWEMTSVEGRLRRVYQGLTWLSESVLDGS